MTLPLVGSDSDDGAGWAPNREDGESIDDFPSALIAALLANNPLELFKIDESLLLTCFRGLSRNSRDGESDGVWGRSAAETADNPEADFDFVSEGSVAAPGRMVGNVDVDTDFP